MNSQKHYDFFRFHGAAKANVEFLINKWKKIPMVVVEIGVYKGDFTFNMTNMIASKFPEYKHYAIDPFVESYELPNNFVQDGYKSFINNLDICKYKNNIEFIKKPSREALYDLYNRGVKANLIYIDGDHRSPEVLQDLVLSWNILGMDGVMLCDDASCHWYVNDKNERMSNFSPKLAIDSFVNCFWDRLDPLQLTDNWQFGFVKRKE